MSSRIPFLLVSDDGVKGDDHLPHAGDYGDLWFFAFAFETLIEGLDFRIEADRGDGRHVEHGADLAPPAMDGSL